MITASIVTYETNVEELRRVLLCATESSIEHIYIVDNSSNDNLRFLEKNSSKLEYIYGHGNIGYGAAHNIAIKKSIKLESKYHIVLNPDIYFEYGTIERLINYINNNYDIGLVMPKVIYPDGTLQYLCKLLPNPIDLIIRRFMPMKKYVEKWSFRFEMRGSGYDKEMMVPFLSGCFMLFRTDALVKTGGFDDRFFMYCEDIDICRRILAAGYKTYYYPAVSIIHMHRKESFKSNKMLRVHMKSAIIYFNKWGWFFDKYRAYINKKALEQY